MQRQAIAITVGVIVSYAAIAVFSYLPLKGAWGYNHFAFLSPWFVALVAAGMIMSLLLLFIKPFMAAASSGLESIGRALWEGGPLPRALVVLASMLLFWLLRADVHFLGDGYGIINLYADHFTRLKTTSFGAIWLLRAIQFMFGEYSVQTSEMAFEIMSVASGGVAVYGFLSISRWITDQAAGRTIAFLLLVSSGAVLLFFGYTELYPPVWAAGSLFFAASLRYLQTRRGFWIVVITFLLTAAMHMLAVLLIFAVVFLPFPKLHRAFRRDGVGKVLVPAVLIFLVLGFVAYTSLYAESLRFRVTFLPVFQGRPQSPDYGAISVTHFLDILNLFLVIIPALPVMLIGLVTAGRKAMTQPVPVFLMISGFALGLFLVTAEPDLGMARDWDLMSFTVLPWLVLLIWILFHGRRPFSVGQMSAAVVISLVVTTGYVAANLYRPSAEERFHAVLQYYGSFNRGGWITFQDYFLERGQTERALGILDETNALFPQYRLMDSLHALIDSNQIQAAYPLARKLIRDDPDNPFCIQLMARVDKAMGNLQEAESLYVEAIKLRPFIPEIKVQLSQVYVAMRRPDKALKLLEEARKLAPHDPKMLEGLGLAYYLTGNIDSTNAIGRQMLRADPHSAAGHAMVLMSALARGDTATARIHYEEFVKYGQDRPDYEQLKKYYGDRMR